MNQQLNWIDKMNVYNLRNFLLCYEEELLSLSSSKQIETRQHDHTFEWSNNFLSSEQLDIFYLAVMAYKIMNNLCPESLWNKFQRRSQYSSYKTRFCRDLQIPRYNLENAKKDFPILLLRSGMKFQLMSGSFLSCTNSKKTKNIFDEQKLN